MRGAVGPPVRLSEAEPGDFAARAAPYRQSLLRMLRGLLPTPEDAEDVLQEALLHAFIALPGLRRQELFGPWLRTVAYNRAMDWQRRRYAEASVRPYLWREPVDDGGVGRVAARVDLVAALGLLAPEDRGLILLRYAEQVPAVEIARAQGESAATVRSRLHRAKRVLRAKLEHQGGIGDE